MGHILELIRQACSDVFSAFNVEEDEELLLPETRYASVVDAYRLGRQHALDELEEWYVSGPTWSRVTIPAYVAQEREILESVRQIP